MHEDRAMFLQQQHNVLLSNERVSAFQLVKIFDRNLISGDDIEEIVLAVKHSMQQCCLQLKAKLVKRQAAQQQRERKQILAKHIPNAAQAFMDVLQVRLLQDV